MALKAPSLRSRTMYGMVNRAVRDMVIARFGTEAWTRVHTEAVSPAEFDKMQSYDDGVTYRLVRASAQVLRLPPETVMRTFGVYWVMETAEKGYGPLLALWGSSFVEFLSNLDALHARVAETFTGLKPPSFEVVEEGEGMLEVSYRSHRPGLAPFVAGLIEGVGQRFDTKVDVLLVRSRALDGGDVDVFRVGYQPGA